MYQLLLIWNSLSLVKQITSFQSFIYANNIDLIALTETWLNNHNYSNKLIPTNYTIYRNDRTSCHGGVMFAVNSSINSSLVNCPSHLELSTIKLNSIKSITICQVYIPPNPDHKYISDLINYLTSLHNVENLILLSDLNLPDVNWDSFVGESYISSSLCEIFLILILLKWLLILLPTRVTC